MSCIINFACEATRSVLSIPGHISKISEEAVRFSAITAVASAALAGISLLGAGMAKASGAWVGLWTGGQYTTLTAVVHAPALLSLASTCLTVSAVAFAVLAACAAVALITYPFRAFIK